MYCTFFPTVSVGIMIEKVVFWPPFFVDSVVVPFLQFVVHAISRPLPVGHVGVDDELQETDYIL